MFINFYNPNLVSSVISVVTVLYFIIPRIKDFRKFNTFYLNATL